jgi:hypothetical protein
MTAGTQKENALRIWQLCQGCAAAIYDTRPPAAAYAERVARLLFGTAAQESEFIERRQHGRDGRPLSGDIGAFGLWQVEIATSVEDSLRALYARPGLLEHAKGWLPAVCSEVLENRNARFIAWFMTVPSGDPLAVLFARLHYLFRTKDPVPESVEDQAAYWKRWYNTIAGAGTVEQYLTGWRQRCAHIVALESGAPVLGDAS